MSNQIPERTVPFSSAIIAVAVTFVITAALVGAAAFLSQRSLDQKVVQLESEVRSLRTQLGTVPGGIGGGVVGAPEDGGVGTPGGGGGVMCAQDAKQCPNGSYVTRTGPNCEFAACPD
jgi:hypothetical protein